MFNETKTEVEIYGCNISLGLRRKSRMRNYSIGYKFIFNKKTQYEFIDYTITFNIGDTNGEKLQIRLHDLDIQFKTTTNTCPVSRKKRTKPTTVQARFDSNEEIYPCKPKNKKQKTESTTTVSTNINRTTFTTLSSTTNKKGLSNYMDIKHSTTYISHYSTNIRGINLTTQRSMVVEDRSSNSGQAKHTTESIPISTINHGTTSTTGDSTTIKITFSSSAKPESTKESVTSAPINIISTTLTSLSYITKKITFQNTDKTKDTTESITLEVNNIDAKHLNPNQIRPEQGIWSSNNILMGLSALTVMMSFLLYGIIYHRTKYGSEYDDDADSIVL
ncbi:hypothetical protein RF11_04377 [Thelohanellus kitauei]|uniref:Uncharacterized protein n=1 Tax=Thelohanellus kitauei TaxID=669202 RepID=A0A0C2MN10_THEKT|nr:hypothetical protein RF11_04377 [Thelohanellus kitauei]